MYEDININVLIGQTLKEIIVDRNLEVQNDSITFITTDNKKYILKHQQDCSESVTIDDINGDLQLLIGKPILLAEEVTNECNKNSFDSFTWTFYRIANNQEFVTIKFYGSSNGYYSESVSFKQIE